MNDIKKDDRIYCSNCGKLINENATICPLCGFQLKELKVKKNYPEKNKTAAFVLALIFGGWSWLYTYKIDQLKFWIFFSAWVLSLILCSYTGFEVSFINSILAAVNFIGWFWSLFDAIKRPLNFYISYPYG